ncbi:MAG: lysophospholipase [Limnochordia bacterium]|jgi:alpha-beta hydrolase superfamily lysophospholipase|nr:alpha/beta hydrolase [Bacillota bacterium]NLL08680.1 alpha/beta hydrolase [Bacillota bacterium]HBG10086.1 alpha/beta hydrolase [Bacillota bacterium]
MQTLFLKVDDGSEIFVRKWNEVQQPQGMVQIAHGMAEHSGRYHEFAKFLNAQGFLVAASDHRGHGKTGEKAGIRGYFAPENGFDRVVDDLHFLSQQLKAEHPELPLFLFGHSMGSFLTRRYLQRYCGTAAGAILMGSGGDPGFAAKLGKLVARWQMRRDPTQPSPLLDTLSFGSFNKGIKAPRTKFDWLTRDPREVQKYMDDPFCGMVCSSGFFFDLLTGLQLIHDPQEIERIPKNIPLLVLSGEADPVGKYGRGVRQFVGQLKNHNINDIELKLYPEARHELLNELNKTEVMQDVAVWLRSQVDKD